PCTLPARTVEIAYTPKARRKRGLCPFELRRDPLSPASRPRPVLEAGPRDGPSLRPGLVLDRLELRRNLLEALHQAGQVVFVAELALKRAPPLVARHEAHLLEFGQMALHLARAQVDALAERLLARPRLAVGVPPVVGQVHHDRQLRRRHLEPRLRVQQQRRDDAVSL